jgi:DNA-binding transcriptional MerR regulator
MGVGGGGGIKRQLDQQNQQMQAQELALQQSQAALNAKLAESDKATKTAVDASFADATGATSQKAAQLGILDYIKTSPSGLNNKAKTGKPTLLGN